MLYNNSMSQEKRGVEIMKEMTIILELYNDGKMVHISHNGSFGCSYDCETIKDLLLSLKDYMEDYTND